MPSYHATITGPDQAAMAALVSKYKVTVARHTVEKVAGGFRVDAHASGTQLRALEKAGYAVERLEDADKTGKARQKETRKLTARAVAPEALKVAQSTGYLNIDEVEAALAAAALAPNKAFTKLISLPNKTWEQRTCHALKLAKGFGLHAPRHLFARRRACARVGQPGYPDPLRATRLRTRIERTRGITIATKKFTAAQIQSIVETKDIYIFPQANPDGRHYSMTTEPMWRKNRRPAPAGHTQTQCVGVDINRNYNFLWDFPTVLRSGIADSRTRLIPAITTCTSARSAASEPETKNAVWMFDKFPHIRYFVDLHSYSEDILYNWGDDENQTTSPSMNFQNAAYNGKRGIANDKAYREYLAAADKTIAVGLANKMRDAIKAVRGRVYKTEQAMSLYPTAGTSDDYAFSRHIVNPKKAKVFSYTIEWGSPYNPTPFHPLTRR